MLGAEPYAAVSVIPGAEFQAIGPALLVINIREFAGIAAAYVGGAGGGTAYARTYGSWAYGDRARDSRACRGGAGRARHAAATIFATRAIGCIIASA